MSRTQSSTVIVPWAVRIEQNHQYKHEKKLSGPLPLSSFDGKGADLLLLFDAFVRGLYMKRLINRDYEHFGRPQNIVRLGRTLSLDMKGGISGRERDIRLAANSGDERLERTGIVWSTYQLEAIIPSNSIVGWVMAEKDGGDSIPGAWRKEFIKLFKARHPQFRLKFAQVRSEGLWQLLESSDVNNIASIEIARRDGDPNSEKNTRGFPRNVQHSRIDTYVAPTGKMTGDPLKRIRRFFTVARDANGVVEIDLADEQDDFSKGLDIRLRNDVLEITVHATINGRAKTVRFSGASEPYEVYPVEDLGIERISADRFRKDCRDHVTDLAKISGVTLAQGWDTGEWPSETKVDAMEVVTDDITNEAGT